MYMRNVGYIQRNSRERTLRHWRMYMRNVGYIQPVNTTEAYMHRKYRYIQHMEHQHHRKGGCMSTENIGNIQHSEDA